MSFARKIKRKQQAQRKLKEKKLERKLFCPLCGHVMDYDVLEDHDKLLQVMRCGKCGYCEEVDHDPYGSDLLEDMQKEIDGRPTGDCDNCPKAEGCGGMVWPCDPEKATDCKKTNCYINGGPCNATHKAEAAEDGAAPYCARLAMMEGKRGASTT